MDVGLHTTNIGKRFAARVETFIQPGQETFSTLTITSNNNEFTLFVRNISDLRPILDAISTALCIPTPPTVTQIDTTAGQSDVDQNQNSENQN